MNIEIIYSAVMFLEKRNSYFVVIPLNPTSNIQSIEIGI